MSDGTIVILTVVVSTLIYNLYKLSNAKDPKDELLKVKHLLDEGLIESEEYEKIKKKLLKRIVPE